jgi:hypothetical protein
MALLLLASPPLKATLVDGPDGYVSAIARGADGITYLGGAFTAWGAQTGGGAALAIADGVVNRSFPKVSGVIKASVSDGAGGFFIGGSFTEVGDFARNNLAQIDASGAVTTWNPNADSVVNALAISGSTVYAGGEFTNLGGITRNRLAAIGTDGSLGDWNPNADNSVNSLIISDSTVYAGGGFTSLGGTPRNYLAAIGTDGTLNTWDPNADNVVNALAISGSTVYAGGYFTNLGNTSRNRLAAIDATTGLVNSNWNPNASGTITSLAISGSKVYAGGGFTTIGGSTRNRLAAIGADGSLTTWDPNASSTVTSLAISGSTVYAGGFFTTLGGIPRNRLAAINAVDVPSPLLSGDVTTWNPNANSYVSSLAIRNSTLYAGGDFTRLGDVLRRGLAAVDAITGAVNSSWNPNPNSLVNTLAISGSTVYAGGYFTNIGGSPRNRLAAINAVDVPSPLLSGDVTTWNPNANSNVNTLVINNSTVFAGGAFTSVSSNTRNRLAAIGTAGTLASWDPNANGTVNALAISGSTVYAGGAFTSVGGSSRNQLAAIGNNGVLSMWNPNANGTVNALALSGNNVYVGGTFSNITSETQPNVSTSKLGVLKALPCSSGIPLTTGTNGIGSLWQMLALPCVSANGSIAGVFGTGTLSNLTTANYAVDQTNVEAASRNGWLIEDKTVGAVPAYEPLLTSDIALSVGTGYWIKSYQAPTNGTLAMDGTTTPAVVTQAEGCYSANGCKAITVSTYSALANRYNLVGNPFAFPIDWSTVRVRVDGSATTYTPAQAAGVATGDPLNLTTPVISNIVNIWNNTSYVAFTDVAPYTSTPNLQYFKSFWVNVLPGAFGHTIELLIPAEQSTQPIVLLNPVAPVNLEQLATIKMPWFMGWLDWVVSPAAAAVPVVKTPVKPKAPPNFKDWSIRLKVNNPVTGWQDNGNLLGQLNDAQVGYDNHDVPEMTPFAAPFMTLVFPHPDWLTNAADYCGDFHSPSKKVDSWTFEIRANPVGSKVFLNWAGDVALLKRSRLIDAATGKVIKPSDKRWAKNGYPITLKKDVQRYVWKVLAK